jgi:hypothetical protein
LGGLSLSIIVSSFDYNSKIDAQRLEMEELRAELLENPSPKSLNEFENEEELNNVILYNLEQVANVFLLSSILVLGAVLFQLISAITLLSTLHKVRRRNLIFLQIQLMLNQIQWHLYRIVTR